MWTPQGAAVKASVVLLANASAHISVERRKGVMKYFNRDLKHLAEEQYPKYSPFLFGEGFACKVKATADGIKALNGAQQKSFIFLAAVAQNTSPRVAATSGPYPSHHSKRQFSNVSVLQQTTDNSKIISQQRKFNKKPNKQN